MIGGAVGPRRPGLAPAAVTVLALVGTACGAGAPTATTPDVTASTIGPATAGDLQAVVAAARTTAGLRAGVALAVQASQVFGSAPKPVQGQGVFDFGAQSGQASMAQPAGVEHLVFLPASLYVTQAGGTSVLPKGKSWISAGLTESALTVNFPQFVIQVESLNPVFLLEELAWGAVSAAPLGPLPVDGAPAQGYATRIDLSRAAANAGGKSAAAFARAIGFEQTAVGTTGAGSPGVTVRVWLDGNGRVVQLVASPAGAGLGTVTMTLGTFGVPVQVSVPPKRQVVDIAALSPGGERENNGGGDSDGA